MAQKNFVGNTALGKAFELIRTWVTGELVKKADVSAVPTKVSDLTNDAAYQTKTQVDTALEAKQDKLTAGANITIQDGTISASGVLTEVSWGGITGTLASQTDLKAALDAKADATALTTHTGNAEIHVTAAKKAEWDAKVDEADIADFVDADTLAGYGYQNAAQVGSAIDTKLEDYTDTETLTTQLAAKANATDLTAHTSNNDIHVTTTDKNTWNGKTTMAEVEAKGYQTATQVESAITAKGYQTQAQVSQAITAAVADITSFEFQVVGELPGTGEKGIIYLVAHTHGEGDTYDEYIWVNNAFEKIGNTDIDLSGYVLSTDLVEITAEEVQDLWDETVAA